MTTSGKIRAGMGGWTFEPWDTSFYPEKLAKTKQLQYASRQVPTIEVNGTYYSSLRNRPSSSGRTNHRRDLFSR